MERNEESDTKHEKEWNTDKKIIWKRIQTNKRKMLKKCTEVRKKRLRWKNLQGKKKKRNKVEGKKQNMVQFWRNGKI